MLTASENVVFVFYIFTLLYAWFVKTVLDCKVFSKHGLSLVFSEPDGELKKCLPPVHPSWFMVNTRKWTGLESELSHPEALNIALVALPCDSQCPIEKVLCAAKTFRCLKQRLAGVAIAR